MERPVCPVSLCTLLHNPLLWSLSLFHVSKATRVSKSVKRESQRRTQKPEPKGLLYFYLEQERRTPDPSSELHPAGPHAPKRNSTL